MNSIGVQVVNTLEELSHANGPVNGRRLYFQDLFNLIKQLDRIANIAIHLVNKANDRGIA